MNRKIHLGWFVAVLALCCVWLVFSSFMAIDSLEAPELGNDEEIPAKTSFPGMAGEATASLNEVGQKLGAQAGHSTPTTIDDVPHVAAATVPPAIPPSQILPKRATLRASAGGDNAGLSRAPPSRAVVKIGGREIAPPNFSGHYQRVLLGRRGKAEIRVEFPEDKVSQEVLVRAIQGGKINGGENYAVFDLGQGRRQIAFTFESGEEAGLSEIILRRGTTEEVLQFWAPTDKPQYDPPALSAK